MIYKIQVGLLKAIIWWIGKFQSIAGLGYGLQPLHSMTYQHHIRADIEMSIDQDMGPIDNNFMSMIWNTF